MDICVPNCTDWSCRWTPEQLADARMDPIMAPKIAKAEAFAWSLLASLTLYRIGTCPITVRPCAERCMPASGTYRTAIARGGHTSGLPVTQIGQPSPYISGGVWYNACGCGSAGGCGCASVPTVVLPGPVGKIESVSIGGVELPRSAYRVDNGNRLIRQDGAEWPLCQDLSAPSAGSYEPVSYMAANGTVTLTRVGQTVTATVDIAAAGSSTQPAGWNPWPPTGYTQFDEVFFYADGSVGLYTQAADIGKEVVASYQTEAPATLEVGNTFEVTYYRGAAPNMLTSAAAGQLANEFLLACDGDAACRLPYNVTSMVRSGESYDLDQTDFMDGNTGIPEVQAVLRIYNPNGLKSPVIVASPDMYLTPTRTA